MRNIQVDIDNNSGFCFGVVYAIEIAEEVLNEQGYLYCLGDIVHNDEEIKRLEKKGLRIINHIQLKNLRKEMPNYEIIRQLIRSAGSIGA